MNRWPAACALTTKWERAQEARCWSLFTSTECTLHLLYTVIVSTTQVVQCPGHVISTFHVTVFALQFLMKTNWMWVTKAKVDGSRHINQHFAASCPHTERCLCFQWPESVCVCVNYCLTNVRDKQLNLVLLVYSNKTKPTKCVRVWCFLFECGTWSFTLRLILDHVHRHVSVWTQTIVFIYLYLYRPNTALLTLDLFLFFFWGYLLSGSPDCQCGIISDRHAQRGASSTGTG